MDFDKVKAADELIASMNNIKPDSSFSQIVKMMQNIQDQLQSIHDLGWRFGYQQGLLKGREEGEEIGRVKLLEKLN